MVSSIFVHCFEYPIHIPWCFRYFYIALSIPFTFHGVFDICTFLQVSLSYSIVCHICTFLFKSIAIITFHGVFNICTFLRVSHSHSVVFSTFVHSFEYPIHIPLCVPYLFILWSIPFTSHGVFRCTFHSASHWYSMKCSIIHFFQFPRPIHIPWCRPLYIP